MPIVENITVWRGENITLHMTMTPATDITGWVISMTVTKAGNMSNKVFQVTGVNTNGPAGKYDLILSGNLDRAPGTYKYDIFRHLPSERILNIGDFIIAEDSRYPT